MNKVLVLAGDTDGNTGDRAILSSTCDELRRASPGIHITLLSGDPQRDRSLFGAEIIPRGARGLIHLIRAARESDLVLCGGGGLFQDDASLVKMPYWALRIALVRCFAQRIIGYSLGVGPLAWGSSRLAARLAFACMEAVSVRDDLAKTISEPLTSKSIQLVPDPALVLPAAPQRDADRVLEQAGVSTDLSPLVGVAVRRWFHHRPTLIPHKYAVKYGLRRVPGRENCARMIALLAEVLDRLVEEQGAFILFLPTYNVAHEADDEICEAVSRKMNADRKRLIRIDDPRLYKAVAGRMSVVLAGRMHAAILAAAMGTPVVGLSYNQKFEGFFRLIGCQDRVINLEDFVEKQLTSELFKLLSERGNADLFVLSKVRELSEQTRRYTAQVINGTPPAPDPRVVA